MCDNKGPEILPHTVSFQHPSKIEEILIKCERNYLEENKLIEEEIVEAKCEVKNEYEEKVFVKTECIEESETHQLEEKMLIEKIKDEDEVKYEENVLESIQSPQPQNDESTDEELVKQKTYNYKRPPSVKRFKCDECPYRATLRGNLNRHKLTHKKDSSERPLYKCNLCDLKYKTPSGLSRHMLSHKDPSEIRWYKCNLCDYKAKGKCYLRSHMVVHEEVSEHDLFKCDECPYQGKRLKHLNQHKLTHKTGPEVVWYGCDLCMYKSKIKGTLMRHMLIHKDDKLFKCEICTFKTNQRGHLNQHKLTHQSDSETVWYECGSCDYKSRYKRGLQRHSLLHKDLSDDSAKDDKSSYQPRQRYVLYQRRLKDVPSEEPPHQHGDGNFKMKIMTSFKKLMLQHQEDDTSGQLQS